MSDDLRAQVARIQPGDKVTATFEGLAVGPFTVSGTAYSESTSAYIHVGRHCIRVGETPSAALVSIDAHEPALPPEPPVGSVVVKGDEAWMRCVDGGWRNGISAFALEWSDIADGTVIFTPGGES